MDNASKFCLHCGTELAANAKTCPKCGYVFKRPFYKKKRFLIPAIFLGLIIISNISNNNTSKPAISPSVSQNTQIPQTADIEASAFDGDCGISASGQLGNSIINQPELTISIKNTSTKNIAAINFFVEPVDVYGEKLSNWTSQKYLYTDDEIKAGATTKIQYQFLDRKIKTINLYVYSVYFSDGTEWGNKDATESTILKNAHQISVAGKS